MNDDDTATLASEDPDPLDSLFSPGVFFEQPLLPGLQPVDGPPRDHMMSSRERYTVLFLLLLGIILKVLALSLTINEIHTQVTVYFNTAIPVQVADAQLMTFTWTSTMKQFLSNGAYTLATVMIIGSVIVPMLRFGFLLSWFLFPVKRSWRVARRRLLYVLDHVGRFTMADLFSNGFANVIFYIKVRLGQVEVLTGSHICYAFYLGLISNTLGTVVTHYMIVVENRWRRGHVSLSSRSSKGFPMDKQRLLLGTRLSLLNPKSWVFSRASQFIMFSGIVLSLLVMFHQVQFRPTLITFHVQGLIGKLTQAQPIEFDIFTVFETLPAWALNVDKNGFPLSFIAFVYVVVVILVPILMLIVSVALIVIPMKSDEHLWLLSLYPFWFSWAALDVFFIVAFSNVYELSVVATASFGEQFRETCDRLEKKFHLECFRLDTKSHTALFYLGGASLSLFVVRAFVGSVLMEIERQDKSAMIYTTMV